MATLITTSTAQKKKAEMLEAAVANGDIAAAQAERKRPADPLSPIVGINYGGEWYPSTDPRAKAAASMMYMLPAPAGNGEPPAEDVILKIGDIQVQNLKKTGLYPVIIVTRSRRSPQAYRVSLRMDGRTGRQKMFRPVRRALLAGKVASVSLLTAERRECVVTLDEWGEFVERLEVRAGFGQADEIDLTPQLKKMARDVISYSRERPPTKEEWKKEIGQEEEVDLSPLTDFDFENLTEDPMSSYEAKKAGLGTIAFPHWAAKADDDLFSDILSVCCQEIREYYIMGEQDTADKIEEAALKKKGGVPTGVVKDVCAGIDVAVDAWGKKDGAEERKELPFGLGLYQSPNVPYDKDRPVGFNPGDSSCIMLWHKETSSRIVVAILDLKPPHKLVTVYKQSEVRNLLQKVEKHAGSSRKLASLNPYPVNRSHSNPKTKDAAKVPSGASKAAQ